MILHKNNKLSLLTIISKLIPWGAALLFFQKIIIYLSISAKYVIPSLNLSLLLLPSWGTGAMKVLQTRTAKLHSQTQNGFLMLLNTSVASIYCHHFIGEEQRAKVTGPTHRTRKNPTYSRSKSKLLNILEFPVGDGVQ